MRGYKRSNNTPTIRVVNNSINQIKSVDLTTSLEDKLNSFIKPAVDIMKPTFHKRPAIGKPKRVQY